MSHEKLRSRTATVITVTWVVSLTLDALPTTILEYTASPWVHAAMMAVAGYLFAPTVTGRQEKNGRE